MMKNSDSDNTLTLGYDLDSWYGYGKKEKIRIDISARTNSHMLICGMSGSGKSYAELLLFCKLYMISPQAKFYLADYKQEDHFSFLRSCPRYYPYKRTTEALELVYEKLQQRQSGEDKSQTPVTLLWDEYVANLLALQNEDKKRAATIMNNVSEILMLGRSLGIRLFVTAQRPDAAVFPAGARLNYGIILCLGAPHKSILDMIMPECADKIDNREFHTGEGLLLLQGNDLHFIKTPTVQDMNRMQELCIKALSSS